ncbi:MAG TPA: VOC family protein [Myxococcota bacterium]|nr:VOC family protein [Myxococcota bacterium]
MGVIAVSHIAVGVRDMERALRFYRDVIGLEITSDRLQKFTSFTTGRPVERRGVFLRWRNGPHQSFLVLDQLLPEAAPGKALGLFDLGAHHFSFWVDDVDAVVEKAQAAGFPVVFPHVADTEDYGEPRGGRVKSAFLQDADGSFVQVDQRL